jgi:hypothetical protein
MAMAESTQTLDAVLTLLPADASARLLEMADGAESVRDVLKRVMEGRYPAAPGMLVAASVLANSDPRSALLQPAFDLGQLQSPLGSPRKSWHPQASASFAVAPSSVLRQM